MGTNIRNKKKSAPDIKPNPEGRPRHFDTPESLMNAFKKYVIEMTANELPLTISGFCVYCDAYKDLLNEYDKKPQFSRTIKQIRMVIENCVEVGILINKYNATAGIFNLKNNFSWTDKTEIDQNNTNLNISADKENLTELKALIRKARESKESE